MLHIARMLPTLSRQYVITGGTTETGTGTKSPDNPYALTGIDRTMQGTIETVLPAEVQLFSLPNGVRDEYDVLSGKGIRRVGKVVLDGSQSTYGFHLSPARAWASLTVAGVKPNTSSDSDSNLYSDKLTSRTPNQTWAAVHSVSRDIAGKITVSIAPDAITVARDLLNRLAANPITVLYELAEPAAFDPVNLLRNSGFRANLSGIYIGPNVSRDPSVILQDCVALKSAKTSKSYVAFWDFSILPAGAPVSFSVWYKTSVSDTIVAGLHFGTETHGYIGGKGMETHTLIADGEWHRAEFTTTTPTVPAGAVYTRAEFNAPAGDAWFACPKFELGPYATGYVPSPAD